MEKETKQILRNEMKKFRPLVENRSQKELVIKDKLLSFLKNENPESIFIYVSFGSEIDTKGIIETLFHTKKIFVPFVENGSMQVRRLLKTDNLSADKQGNIAKTSLSSPIDSKILDIAIVPLLCFNNECFRIGYGGGYYDRFLSDFSFTSIGLAFDEMLREFAPEPFDMPLSMIITPKNNYQSK